jgi:DtxR family Mn-dependent transcriptional regulator
MSPVLEERMLAAIGDAKTCPHGHPIIEGTREQGALLADVESGATVHVLRFENEAEEILHYLKAAGLRPGLDGTLERSDEQQIVLASNDGEHVVSRSVAETVSVRADPSPDPRPPLPEQLELSSDRYGR